MDSSIRDNVQANRLAILDAMTQAKLGVAQENKRIESDATAVKWELWRRILFRFAFAYLVLYFLPAWLVWSTVVPWVGANLFQVDVAFRLSGSGDKTFDYIHLFCCLTLAGATTMVWSFLDRKRPNYARMYDGTRVFLRFMLALTMMIYGFGKVDQFSAPSLEALVTPLGELPPMRLLWSFMGVSLGYKVFAGIAEVVGGLLLTTRRTTLLGALIVIGVMSNVVMLNLCYDVPVKLYSSHLLLFAVVLVAPEMKRLINFFVLNRPVEPTPLPPAPTNEVVKWGVHVIRSLSVCFIMGVGVLVVLVGVAMAQQLGPKPEIHGIWNLEELIVDGKAQPLLVTEKTLWRRMILEYGDQLTIQFMNDARVRCLMKLDEKERTIVLTKEGDANWKATLKYTEIEPGLLVLEGIVDGKAVRMQLRRFEESRFMLNSRGFHWINENPFNR